MTLGVSFFIVVTMYPEVYIILVPVFITKRYVII